MPPITPTLAQGFSPEILTLHVSPSQLTINASEPASKQIVILHDSPSSSPTALINELIGSLQVASLYVTDDSQDSGDMNPYNSFPTFWNQFVDDVAAAATS